jgi:hypothetical protein
MTSLETILRNFYFEPVNENKFPNHGKVGRQDYQFICKRCNSISEPMKFEPDIRYRLVSHLVNHCRPSHALSEQLQQGPAE